MSKRTLISIILSLIAFAGNSIVCRMALKSNMIDPASFVIVRLGSASLMLILLQALFKSPKGIGGNWISAMFLLLYAIPFTFSYVNLSAATGALISFSAVQLTMILMGIRNGEVINRIQVAGLIIAMSGLIVLLLPGATAPSIFDALLMTTAGIAWGFYSLRGKVSANPLYDTAGNFIRALAIGLVVCIPFLKKVHMSAEGLLLATISGAITSALGYVLWYQALKHIKATQASIIQLSVPVITSLFGVLLLGEILNVRIVTASTVILIGIALVIFRPKKNKV
ncbi:DMT family transporter [Pedobacter immunditicola]|uniref:DMT family transporter n=1 Tax=Pedobacter immunditicola TaxID=3133440 RepID=UPI0030A1A990